MLLRSPCKNLKSYDNPICTSRIRIRSSTPMEFTQFHSAFYHFQQQHLAKLRLGSVLSCAKKKANHWPWLISFRLYIWRSTPKYTIYVYTLNCFMDLIIFLWLLRGEGLDFFKGSQHILLFIQEPMQNFKLNRRCLEFWAVIGRHCSWGLSHISKPVLKYSIRGQVGTSECTVVQYSCVHYIVLDQHTSVQEN